MHCPSCNAEDTKVIDSRLLMEGKTVRRRRKCLSCEHRFTTYEQFQVQLPAVVKSSDGRREPYNREKIMKGLKKACQKRPISMEQIENLLDELEKSLNEFEGKEVPSSFIGEHIMQKLYQLDPVSYIRYGSFYWNFSDVEDFMTSLKSKSSEQKGTQSEQLQ
ncbi:MAG: transcriptional repressor NrdR [Deltaproteobacteria bacterium]|nr:MAG: transcriptional repressor NrdR [Deltaproteobacteria bacterium]TNF30367.1 MAG: transcriptional repressor NrdR [Deltaproteobacteria bacterium]